MITISGKNEDGRGKKKVERLTVSAAEAAEMLGICQRTLWTLTKEKQIPCIRVRRRVLYSLETIQKIVAGNLDGE